MKKPFGLMPTHRAAATRAHARVLGVDLSARFETREEAQKAAECATWKLERAVFVVEDHKAT